MQIVFNYSPLLFNHPFPLLNQLQQVETVHTIFMKSHFTLNFCSTVECAPSVGTQCLSSYYSGSYYTGSTCIDGYCRCPNNPESDYCTCFGEKL